MNINVRFLVKIGEEKFMTELLKKGTVFAKTTAEFRKNDNDDFLRGDFTEGLKYSPIQNLRFKNLEQIKVTRAAFDEKLETTHIYSMYMLDEFFWMDIKSMDEKILGFGDTVVVIKASDFLERMKKKIKIPFSHDRVQYYKAPLVPIQLNPFMKRDGFQFQNEYRFVFKSDSKEPLKFNLGSLKDIATIIPMKTLLSATFGRM